MRLIFAGTPEVALPSLRALLASEHEVLAVLTRPDAPSGRGRRLAPSPVRSLAEEAGVEVLTGRPRDAEVQERIAALAPDCCPVVAYGEILPPEVLQVPRHGWVNLHFSLLPAWRGAAPVQRAIIAGDDVTGASTFVIEEGLDTGPVLGTMTETIRPDDTAGALLDRLADAGSGLLTATLDGLAAGRVQARPQPGEGVSHAVKLTTEEAQIVWTRPRLAIERLIRGCTPSPGAWTTLDGARLGIGPVREADADLAPGEIAAGKREVLVGCADGAVALGEVRPAGKRAMAATDWARGAQLAPGVRCGS